MGYNPKEGCANLLFWASLPRNLYEIFKKWGEGGSSSLAPSLDPPMRNITIIVTIQKTKLCVSKVLANRLLDFK